MDFFSFIRKESIPQRRIGFSPPSCRLPSPSLLSLASDLGSVVRMNMDWPIWRERRGERKDR